MRKITKVSRNCAFCGRVYETIPSNLNSKYCSIICKTEGQKKKRKCVCKICEKVFEVFERYNGGRHAIFCSQICRSSQKIKKICEHCGKSFMIKPSLSSQIFCTSKCRKDFKLKDKMRICKACGNTFEATFACHKSKCCSSICAGSLRIKPETHVVSICTTCGKEFHHTIHDKGRYCSKKCYLNNSGISSQELKLKPYLENLGFNHQLKYDLGHMDFGNLLKKIAVFVDGKFWHGREDIPWKHTKMAPSIARAIERDREQTKYLEDAGWVVLRLWDDEIDKNIDECFYKINNYINNR